MSTARTSPRLGPCQVGTPPDPWKDRHAVDHPLRSSPRGAPRPPACREREPERDSGHGRRTCGRCGLDRSFGGGGESLAFGDLRQWNLRGGGLQRDQRSDDLDRWGDLDRPCRLRGQFLDLGDLRERAVRGSRQHRDEPGDDLARRDDVDRACSVGGQPVAFGDLRRWNLRGGRRQWNEPGDDFV